MICQMTIPLRRIMMAVAIILALSAGAGITRAHSPRSDQQGGNPQRAAALVDEAISVLEKGDEANARNLFQQAIKIDPNNELAHTYLGVLADRAGDLLEAERRFAAAAIAAPTSAAARNNHGAILLKLGRTEQAAKQFEVSLKLNPNQSSALINLAQIRFAAGTSQGMSAARELFEKARAIAPDAEIARSLVVIALGLNDRKGAAAYYQDYAARIAGGAPQISGAAARAELGGALLSAGLNKEASEELAAVVASDPSNVSALLLLARSYLAQKDIPAAGRTLESAVARGIDAAPIYAALADVYQAAGHIENAIPAMRLAIERDPKSEAYRFRYGMLLTDTRAPEAAVIRLNEALKEFPNSPKLWFALGVAHFKKQKHDDAGTAFARSVELDPKFAPALAYLGIVYDETGRYQEAIATYRRAVAADEKLAAAHYLLADALLRQTSADIAGAESHLTRAVQLEPSFAPARLALARLYIRVERFDEAAKQLETVAAADPDQAEAQYQLGRVYMRLKRTEDAQKAVAAFKRLSDDQQKRAQTERQELIRRLANVNF
jgi:tetratricopeptide (TPR) repeat protein